MQPPCNNLSSMCLPGVLLIGLECLVSLWGRSLQKKRNIHWVPSMSEDETRIRGIVRAKTPGMVNVMRPLARAIISEGLIGNRNIYILGLGRFDLRSEGVASMR